ncbi:beta-ketoacyl synthase N-terminal-like domain-containing protein [Streptomyces bohaiensis]|uniref:beta-ketoacyl synthase N-terminal-like domain-containing protein n=1 Tax=Streptomyces bohaiensis TaxID=1431344 RepID=UPI001ADDC4A7|nr:beta-ketoacyl synthase N-terminal-like domain-containing protein [Streptomyces bohaiensis]
MSAPPTGSPPTGSPPARAPGRTAVITATAAITPLADTAEEFGAALLAGRHVPAEPPDAPAGAAPAAMLTGFDPLRWAADTLPDGPATARRLPRLLRGASLPTATGTCVAARVVADAGLPRDWDARGALVLAGGGLGLAHQAEEHARTASGRGPLPSYALTHQDADVLGAASELLGARAEGWTVGGASAAGTLALVLAARTIEAGWADHCVVIAPAAELSAAEIAAYRRSGAMVPAAQQSGGTVCRPFDAARSGFLYAQSAAAVVVESAAAAAARGRPALAVVAGHAQRLDGVRGTGPDAPGQAAVMRAALSVAGLEPADIGYVNAHATGSVLGDATEARALRTVFDGPSPPRVNSTKALAGHALTAAGLLGVVATVAQLRAGRLHPMPHLSEPVDPELGLVGPVAEPFVPAPALATGYAFGGMNAAVVLTPPAPPARSAGPARPSTPRTPSEEQT